MPIASFKNKVFQVSSNQKNTFDGLTWSGDISLEAQEKLKDKPSTYIKGIGLTSMSIDVQLRADFGVNVRNEIEQWEAIRDNMVPDIFVLGTKPLGKNKWLLKSTSVSDTVVDGKGNMLAATLKLEFEEYVREGKASASQGASGGAGGSSAAGFQSYSIVPADIFTPPNKADNKRDNPNYYEATQKVAIARDM
ncbi:hypothetical protein E0485_21830 [Paenibacillus albiflavus]|uniref:Uncharacterized protein n=1 Tax=Paenibacillus albiflavus TaxID=2545760 RepID=A0A4R4E4X3_9BACL|nr:phage tail protein [Paenibacillus albiflavus]TCZ73061.1 hypothetical protein E0485_21830 [Paenibacillus albiflavus]